MPTITRRHASSPRGCRKTDPELGAPARFTDAQALVAYVGFYPVITGERPARRDAPLVGGGLAPRPLGPRPPECRVAHDLPAGREHRAIGQAGAHRGGRQAPSHPLRHDQASSTLQPLTSPFQHLSGSVGTPMKSAVGECLLDDVMVAKMLSERVRDLGQGEVAT